VTGESADIASSRYGIDGLDGFGGPARPRAVK
jgi:hypothetical protein